MQKKIEKFFGRFLSDPTKRQEVCKNLPIAMIQFIKAMQRPTTQVYDKGNVGKEEEEEKPQPKVSSSPEIALQEEQNTTVPLFKKAGSQCLDLNDSLNSTNYTIKQESFAEHNLGWPNIFAARQEESQEADMEILSLLTELTQEDVRSNYNRVIADFLSDEPIKEQLIQRFRKYAQKHHQTPKPQPQKHMPKPGMMKKKGGKNNKKSPQANKGTKAKVQEPPEVEKVQSKAKSISQRSQSPNKPNSKQPKVEQGSPSKLEVPLISSLALNVESKPEKDQDVAYYNPEEVALNFFQKKLPANTLSRVMRQYSLNLLKFDSISSYLKRLLLNFIQWNKLDQRQLYQHPLPHQKQQRYQFFERQLIKIKTDKKIKQTVNSEDGILEQCINGANMIELTTIKRKIIVAVIKTMVQYKDKLSLNSFIDGIFHKEEMLEHQYNISYQYIFMAIENKTKDQTEQRIYRHLLFSLLRLTIEQMISKMPEYRPIVYQLPKDNKELFMNKEKRMHFTRQILDILELQQIQKKWHIKRDNGESYLYTEQAAYLFESSSEYQKLTLEAMQKETSFYITYFIDVLKFVRKLMRYGVFLPLERQNLGIRNNRFAYKLTNPLSIYKSEEELTNVSPKLTDYISKLVNNYKTIEGKDYKVQLFKQLLPIISFPNAIITFKLDYFMSVQEQIIFACHLLRQLIKAPVMKQQLKINEFIEEHTKSTRFYSPAFGAVPLRNQYLKRKQAFSKLVQTQSQVQNRELSKQEKLDIQKQRWQIFEKLTILDCTTILFNFYKTFLHVPVCDAWTLSRQFFGLQSRRQSTGQRMYKLMVGPCQSLERLFNALRTLYTLKQAPKKFYGLVRVQQLKIKSSWSSWRYENENLQVFTAMNNYDFVGAKEALLRMLQPLKVLSEEEYQSMNKSEGKNENKEEGMSCSIQYSMAINIQKKQSVRQQVRQSVRQQVRQQLKRPDTSKIFKEFLNSITSIIQNTTFLKIQLPIILPTDLHIAVMVVGPQHKQLIIPKLNIIKLMLNSSKTNQLTIFPTQRHLLNDLLDRLQLSVQKRNEIVRMVLIGSLKCKGGQIQYLRNVLYHLEVVEGRKMGWEQMREYVRGQLFRVESKDRQQNQFLHYMIEREIMNQYYESATLEDHMRDLRPLLQNLQHTLPWHQQLYDSLFYEHIRQSGPKIAEAVTRLTKQEPQNQNVRIQTIIQTVLLQHFGLEFATLHHVSYKMPTVQQLKEKGIDQQQQQMIDNLLKLQYYNCKYLLQAKNPSSDNLLTQLLVKVQPQGPTGMPHHHSFQVITIFPHHRLPFPSQDSKYRNGCYHKDNAILDSKIREKKLLFQRLHKDQKIAFLKQLFKIVDQANKIQLQLLPFCLPALEFVSRDLLMTTIIQSQELEQFGLELATNWGATLPKQKLKQDYTPFSQYETIVPVFDEFTSCLLFPLEGQQSAAIRNLNREVYERYITFLKKMYSKFSINLLSRPTSEAFKNNYHLQTPFTAINIPQYHGQFMQQQKPVQYCDKIDVGNLALIIIQLHRGINQPPFEAYQQAFQYGQNVNSLENIINNLNMSYLGIQKAAAFKELIYQMIVQVVKHRLSWKNVRQFMEQHKMQQLIF